VKRLLDIVYESVVISKSTDGFRQDEPIETRIRSGQLVAILGDSQSGKTSLLLATGGFLPVRSGRIVYVDPHDDDRPIRLRKRDVGIGTIHRVAPLFDTLTVAEHLQATAKLYRTKHPKKRAQELLESYNLTEYKRERIKDLPHFVHFRVSFACAVVHEPKLVLLDEPERGLTMEEWQLALQDLRSVTDRGAIVVLTTVLEQIADTCDVTLSLRSKEVAR
jgi:ABC-type multidrug transport system ATPase subunit